MNILFIHRGFPAQYKYLAIYLANNPDINVFYITSETDKELNNVHKFIYKPKEVSATREPKLKLYEEYMMHGEAAAKVAMELKTRGYKPDIILGHSWGPTAFVKEIFPDTPFLCYCEWFNQAEGAVIGFDGEDPIKLYREKLRCDNARSLIDLYSCDAGITPTHWQKEQYPKEFQDKIKVIHDGIYTDECTPDKSAKFLVKEKNIELTAQDEVITYATRGMEPIRGFPQFMEAVSKIQKKRPNAHFVIAGFDMVFYGIKNRDTTHKKQMLEKLNLDMSKIHFVNFLDFPEYLNLLRISSAHVYLTYPFILSWSLLEAMSVGCCIIGSDTKPVLEVIQDNYNGLITEFFNVDMLVEKIEYALDNKEEMEEIRANARKTVLEKYSLSVLLPQHLNYMQSIIDKAKENQ